jgi:hypothetical protein
LHSPLLAAPTVSCPDTPHTNTVSWRGVYRHARREAPRPARPAARPCCRLGPPCVAQQLMRSPLQPAPVGPSLPITLAEARRREPLPLPHPARSPPSLAAAAAASGRAPHTPLFTSTSRPTSRTKTTFPTRTRATPPTTVPSAPRLPPTVVIAASSSACLASRPPRAAAAS